MRYLAIAFLAVAMSLGGMSTNTYAKVGDMWVVKETPKGKVWKKFDKKAHIMKYKKKHHMRNKHWKKHKMKHKRWHHKHKSMHHKKHKRMH